MSRTWRQRAQAVIAELWPKYKDRPYKEWKAALRAAGPGTPPPHYPYRVWCEEQRKALDMHPGAPPRRQLQARGVTLTQQQQFDFDIGVKRKD